jgi:hypothetical protein
MNHQGFVGCALTLFIAPLVRRKKEDQPPRQNQASCGAKLKGVCPFLLPSWEKVPAGRMSNCVLGQCCGFHFWAVLSSAIMMPSIRLATATMATFGLLPSAMRR